MNKNKYLIVVALFVVIFLITISCNFKPSTTISRYRSEINGSDSSARVAKWSINSITKKNGQSISLDAGFNENIEDGSGNWFFDIENKSEVVAHIKDGGKITLRLDSDSLDSYEDKIKWNFINGVKNPISFKIYVYNASASSLLFYEKDSNLISFDDYEKLSITDKIGYIEVLKKDDSVTELKLLDTDNTELIFDKGTEIVNSKIKYYYQLQVDLTDSLKSQIYELGFNETNSSICFRVAWSVSGEKNESTLNNTDESYYYANKVLEGISTNISDLNYTIGNKNYYIEKKQLTFFNYLKYTSSLGGEPRFEFQTTGGKKLVAYSELTQNQKNTIENYKNLKINSLEDLNKYTEYLEYLEYKRFSLDNEEFIKELSYLVMGLKISINFNLTVEQVD